MKVLKMEKLVMLKQVQVRKKEEEVIILINFFDFIKKKFN